MRKSSKLPVPAFARLQGASELWVADIRESLRAATTKPKPKPPPAGVALEALSVDGDAPEHHLPKGSAMRESDELPWNKGRKTRRSRPGLVQVHPPDGGAEGEAAGGGSRDGGASGSFGSADDPPLDGAATLQQGAALCRIDVVVGSSVEDEHARHNK